MYYEFTVKPEHDGSTLRTFLRRECGITARSMTVLKYGEGGIYRGNQEIKAHESVRSGDVISIRLPEESNDIVPVEGVLSVLYEDPYLLIVDKPSGMPVHPTKDHQLDTLANVVSFYQRQKGESYIFRALNRLDKDTTGCVVIAKDRLCYAMVRDSIQKTYVAVSEGMFDDEGCIDQPIALAGDSKIRRVVRSDGAPAVTHYRSITAGNGHTLTELWLETGRTHQIRCHMSHIGRPLAGDDLYGGSRYLIDHQALHCRSVTLMHPVSKEIINISTDIPSEFLKIIKEGA